MALAFIPITIGALAGVEASEAGVASGLINTSQQIGGAIGVAVATTIAATYTSRYLGTHPGSVPTDGAALTHGFAIAFYVLAVLAALAAIAAASLLESKPALAEGVEEEPALSMAA
jgi:MFS family permease